MPRAQQSVMGMCANGARVWMVWLLLLLWWWWWCWWVVVVLVVVFVVFVVDILDARGRYSAPYVCITAHS